MFQELAIAAGIEYACLVYGFDIEIFQNITLDARSLNL